jgi:dTDP-4-amino-4,6-dideoxygalactose transaminase
MKRFLPYSRQNIDHKDIQSVVRVLKSDFITQGPNVDKFEKEFAKYVGVKYAVACATGTAALHLSCLALGINSDSSLVTSSITFVASANCAEFLGAKVYLTDIDKETYCMCPTSLENLLKTKKIDVVVPVHLSGHSADMEKIFKLKKKYNFKIIEDSCHALGGSFNKYKVGSCKYSDISTFSFHPVKPITTGEGGIITTNNKKIYEKLLIYRTHGIIKDQKKFYNKKNAFDKKFVNRWYYEMIDLGYNYRLTDIQSALGQSQLKKLDEFTSKRNKIARRYNEAFKKNKCIITPKVKRNINHAYHLYTILLDFKKIGKTRNEIMTALFENKIGSQVLYIPIYKQPYYSKKYKFKNINYKNSEYYYNHALSIPIFPDLKPKEQNFIINTINKITI